VSDSNRLAQARLLVDALGEGDARTVELMLGDAEWVIAEEHPDSRTLTDLPSIVAYLEEWGTNFEGLVFTPERYEVRPGAVVALGVVSGRARTSGMDLEVPLALVISTAGGPVTRVAEFLDHERALAAAGSEMSPP
jgi:ketosteroid isomerase-like protein